MADYFRVKMETAWDKQRASQKIPVPSLFVGPPSRRSSIPDQRSQDAELPARDPFIQSQHSHQKQSEATDRESIRFSSNKYVPLTGQRTWRAAEDQSNIWQADAMWAEMQSTLEEVELGAASRANVFSKDHARALEELRKAQVDLARSWARSEADGNEQESESKLEDDDIAETNRQPKNTNDTLLANVAIGQSTRQESQSARIRSASTQSKAHLEDTAEKDIKLARQRRLANDQKFERVNKCVVDVASKLEVVAKKMRNVEVESQEIWNNDKDSIDNSVVS